MLTFLSLLALIATAFIDYSAPQPEEQPEPSPIEELQEIEPQKEGHTIELVRSWRNDAGQEFGFVVYFDDEGVKRRELLSEYKKSNDCANKNTAKI